VYRCLLLWLHCYDRMKMRASCSEDRQGGQGGVPTDAAASQPCEKFPWAYAQNGKRGSEGGPRGGRKTDD
jgi:hypothetical protein